MAREFIFNMMLYIKPSSKIYYIVLAVLAVFVAAFFFFLLSKIYVRK